MTRQLTAAHPYPGCFICLEGIDGSGKSKLTPRCAEFLQSLGQEVVMTYEPGGSGGVSQRIAEILLHLDEAEEQLCPESELLLFFAGRCQHIQRLIIPSLQAGKWVISDRFTPSSYAYQGGGRGLGFAKVSSIAQLLPPLRPDLVIVLDIDAATAAQRHKYTKTADRFEVTHTAEDGFWTAVRSAYLEYAKQHPECLVIDGTLSTAQVWAQVEPHLRQLITAKRAVAT